MGLYLVDTARLGRYYFALENPGALYISYAIGMFIPPDPLGHTSIFSFIRIGTHISYTETISPFFLIVNSIARVDTGSGSPASHVRQSNTLVPHPNLSKNSSATYIRPVSVSLFLLPIRPLNSLAYFTLPFPLCLLRRLVSDPYLGIDCLFPSCLLFPVRPGRMRLPYCRVS